MKQHCNFYGLATNKKMQLKRQGAFAVTLDQCRAINEEGYDIFWTMNGFDYGKRTKADLKWINCFYADIDVGTFSEMKERISSVVEPSSIIKTGKGFHIYWWLNKEISCTHDPEKMSDWFREFVVKRIVPALNADPQAADACRLLRAPFYKYWKDGLGTKFSDIVWESNIFYSIEFLEKYFPVLEKSTPQEKRLSKFKKDLDGGFWDKANNLPIQESLEMLSGTTHVMFETYTFKKQKNIIRIVVNGKKSNAWIDENGRIGSTSGAAPAIPNWLWWYHRDWKKVAEILKEVFHIKEPLNGTNKTNHKMRMQ